MAKRLGVVGVVCAALLITACSSSDTTAPSTAESASESAPQATAAPYKGSFPAPGTVTKVGTNFYEARLAPDRASVAETLANHYAKEYGFARAELDVHCPGNLDAVPGEMTCVLYSQREGYVAAELLSLKRDGTNVLVRFSYSWRNT